MMDDKTSIGIGPVDTPIESTRRQRRVLTVSNNEEGIIACDHDQTPQHLTPSVTLRIDPTQSNINWFQGQVYISFKCAIFSPSNAMQHAAEAGEKIKEPSNPFMYCITDGGPDHKTTNIETHKSYISLWLSLDLDGILVVRTPPYLSVLNPCERVMSTINLALYGLSLSQTPLSPHENDLIKNLTSKTMWRSAQQTQLSKPENQRTDFSKLAEKSLSRAREVLTKRCEQLIYSGNPVKVVPPTDHARIESLYEILSNYFPSFDFTKKGSKADFLKNPEIHKFYEDHVHESTYSLQIKKCFDPVCRFHLPIRSSTELMKKFVWLPVPTTSATDSKKYEDFSVLIENGNGDKPKETCRPGEKGQEQCDPEIKKPNFSYVNGKVRYCIRCTDCGKGRLLYSEYSLNNEDIQIIKNCKEYFVCGINLFKGTSLEQKVFQHHLNNCGKSMTAAYYSTGEKRENYIKICSVCFEDSDYVVENGTYTGLPRCNKCLDGNFVQQRKIHFKKRKRSV